jgi:excinuclease UvrABC nuclease subunit
LTKESDIQVIFNWNKLDLRAPPEVCGVYAITNAKQKTWYYIGKSQNIAKRIAVDSHPVQVTKNTTLDLHYWYLRVAQKHVNWAERYLIKEHDPEWNGATSFDASGYTRWACCDVCLPLTNAEIDRIHFD